MAVTDFVVAIEIGSTRITGIAGRRNADSSIHIIAKESEDSTDCIRKGAIFNLDKTTQLLTNIIKKLEEDLQSPIKKAYVGISGKSMKSIINPIKREFSEETKISQALIDNMMQSNKEIPLVDTELLYVEPQEYKIGNNLLTEPVGINAESINASFLNITARPSLKENIIQCFRHTGCEIADFLISPVETANAVLTESEKRSGCALVDIGAATTTVSVYKNNILRYLAVIPLGGNNITKDICSMQIEEEDAEEIKLKYASAYTEESEDTDNIDKSYSLDGKVTIKAIQLENIVEARINEIISNVWNLITLSNYGDNKLMAGLIITGGTSNMPNIDTAFKRITKIDKIRIAKESLIQTEGFELPKNGTFNTLVGLISAGKENCCRVDPRIGHTIDFVDEPQPAQAKEEKEEKTEQTELEWHIVSDEPQKEAQPEEKSEEKTVETPSVPQEAKQEEETEISQPEEAQQEETVQTEENAVKTEEEIKAEEVKRRMDCQVFVNKAANFIETRRYEEALVEIDHAREFNIPSKVAELDSMEKEAKRLMAEYKRVKAIKDERQKQEIEKLRRQKEDCERIIVEAEEAIEKNDIKEAKERAQEALNFKIPEFNERINAVLEKTQKEQKEKGWFSKAWKKLVNVSEDIMKDN